MAIKNSPGYNTVLSCFISFLIIKRYKMTRMNIEISPIGMNGYVIIFDFFCFSFVVYGACIMAANLFITLPKEGKVSKKRWLTLAFSNDYL